jgi:hypothetical protein
MAGELVPVSQRRTWIMKKMLAAAALAALTSLLGGCYVEPGYSYVRGGSGGDAYYGRSTAVYDDGYYAPAYGGYGYYGYPSGVSIGVSSGWYGGSHGHRSYRNYHDYDRRGGRHDGHYRGDRQWGRDGGHDNRYQDGRGESRSGGDHRGGGHWAGGGGEHRSSRSGSRRRGDHDSR